MPIKEGWEISPDKVEWYEKITSRYNVGDPLLTSKCMRRKDNGFLVVSDKGFAWRIKMGFSSSIWQSGEICGYGGMIFMKLSQKNLGSF